MVLQEYRKRELHIMQTVLEVLDICSYILTFSIYKMKLIERQYKLEMPMKKSTKLEELIKSYPWKP